jgi:tetratricopeptide (TPR) repeat protein
LTTFTGLQVNSGIGWLKLGHAQLRLGQSEPAEKSFRRALDLGIPAGPVFNGIGLTMVQRRLYPVAWQQFTSVERQQAGYAPAILNAAIVADQYLRRRDLAIDGYRKYLALSNPASEDAVRRALALCESAEAAQRASAAPTPPGSPAGSTPPRRAATVPSPAPVPLRKPEPATPSRATDTIAGSGVPASAPRATNQAASTTLPRTEITPSKPITAATNPVEGAASPQSVPRTEQVGNRSPSNEVAAAVQAALASPKPDSTTNASTGPSSSTLPERGAAAPAARVDATGYPYATFDEPRPGDRGEAVRLLNEGLNAQRAQRGRDALEKYRRAAEADPSLFEAHYNRGVAAFEVGELGEALRAYEQALSLNETSVPARFNFSTTLEKAGYPDAAAHELELLLAAHPSEARAHLALGNLYAGRLGKRDLARAHYRKVVDLDPQHPQAGALRFWLEANP